MALKYETKTGDYLDALSLFQETGGRFYPSRFQDSPSVIVAGNRCITVWSENSRLKPKCQYAARCIGVEWEGHTLGRLSRLVWRDLVGLEYKGTSYGDKYKRLAVNGSHWHYTYVETGYHPYLIEFDLKSAYFTSLFHGGSLLYHEFLGFLEDGGALENLKALSPYLTKPLRLTMLGVLASHKHQFYVLEKSSENSVELKLKTRREIKYGAAFNAAHKAVKRTYELMKKIHSIGGEYIKRIHTDSFALTPEIPAHKEVEIFSLLDRNGYTVSIKAEGTAHFLSLNEGIIGNKILGCRQHVFNQFREERIRIPKHELESEEFQRWINRRLEIEAAQNSQKEKEEETIKKFKQLEIGLWRRPTSDPAEM